jgi:hypothetical protein
MIIFCQWVLYKLHVTVKLNESEESVVDATVVAAIIGAIGAIAAAVVTVVLSQHKPTSPPQIHVTFPLTSSHEDVDKREGSSKAAPGYEAVTDVADRGNSTSKRKKAAAKPKVAAVKSSAKTRIVWTVLNDSFKPVETFDFNQKEAADARAAELAARGKGTYFVQKTKEPMKDNFPT